MAAAALYEGFLMDCVDLALGLGWDEVSLVYPGDPGAESALRALLPPDVALVAQPGSGLQAALTEAFAQAFVKGYERVVLIGTDNPTLPADWIEHAAALLEDHDVAIGPSADGGYYLMALSKAHPELFERITWSTDLVYVETMERANEHGLTVASLPRWYDVDTAAELDRLIVELEGLPLDLARQTRIRLSHIARQQRYP
jgi:rSAM/selenodomain-associated transferase 1